MPRLSIFPNKDSEKDAYFRNSKTYLESNATRLRVIPDALADLDKDIADWIDWYQQSQNEETSTKLIVANKNAAKEKVMQTFKTIYGDIPQSVLTADDRSVLKLEERSTTRTPAPVPTTFPVGKINSTNRLEHSISFTNEDGKHGKPEGVRGCQIWCKEGEPALDEKQLLFLGTDTASPFLKKYLIADAGKTIHYWLRWENTRGETGPWSSIISATVLG